MNVGNEAAVNSEDAAPLSEDALLEEIVMTLVDFPDKVRVEEKESPGCYVTILTIHTDPRDHGKVIGKKGGTVRILRELFKRVGTASRKKVFIEVVDTNKPHDNSNGSRPRRNSR